MLKSNFCPNFQCLSLTTFILLGSLAFFIVAVSMGFYKNTFLEVNETTLYNLGMNNSRLVYQGEVWRLIASLFLHVNASHILACIFVLVMVLPFFEYTFGGIVTLLIFLASGITGSIFGNLIQPDASRLMLKTGMNPCLFGIVGCGLGYLVINW